jgi:protein-S-isoprenylcysteine O-methyltransferase Ste14
MQETDMAYLGLLALYLAGLAVRMVYEFLKKQGKVSPSSRPAFLIVFLGMCTMWGSWFSMCEMDPVRLGLPVAVRWFGFILFLTGMVLAVGALIQLRRLENTDHLVTTGLFALVRHPMYLGFLLWLAGWPLYHDAGLSLVPGLLGLGCVLYWRRIEEAALLEQFGSAYESYRDRIFW